MNSDATYGAYSDSGEGSSAAALSGDRRGSRCYRRLVSTLAEAFAKYQRFFVKQYVPSLIEDDPEEGLAELREQGWDDPLRRLKKLPREGVAKLTKDVGPLPAPYVELLTTVGVGPLLASSEEEPIPFFVLKPTEIVKARKAALSWLSPADAKLAEAKLGIDAKKLLPIMTDEGWGFFVMLTRRDAKDDGVVLFDHGYETGHPFRKPKPFATFVKRWIACARALSPLNPFDGI